MNLPGYLDDAPSDCLPQGATLTQAEEALKLDEAVQKPNVQPNNNHKPSHAIGPGARPQIADSSEVWPERWGITPKQLRELLARLRAEPGWKASNNVYATVTEYIKPWTAGTGMGYALLINSADPKEVNIMVSHAWSENCEEFLEAVLRSCHEDDVFFICALSLYQVQDNFGPTIVEQLGNTPEESPFFKVLNHIKKKGANAGWLWRAYPRLWLAPLFFFTAGWFSWLMPLLFARCIPWFTWCAFVPGDDARPDTRTVTKSWGKLESSGSWTAGALPAAIFFGLCGSLSLGLIYRWRGTYRGRMLVAPNREDDLYGRLWCVYEIFVACSLSVPVSMARTLASAGRSSSADAKCSSVEDRERIRGDIVDEYGSQGYEIIDRAILKTTRWSTILMLIILFVSVLPTALTVVGTFLVARSGPPDYRWKPDNSEAMLAVVMHILGLFLGVVCLFHTVERAQGKPSWQALLATAGANVVVGGVICVGSWRTMEQGLHFSCDGGITAMGVVACCACVLTLCTSGLIGTRLATRKIDCRPNDWLVLVIWTTLVLFVFLIEGMWSLAHERDPVYDQGGCGDRPAKIGKNKLFTSLGPASWMQFGFCLTYFSSIGPIFLAVTQMERRPRRAIWLAVLFGYVMLSFITPIWKEKALNFATYWAHYIRSDIAMFALVLWPATLVDRATTYWGIQVIGPKLDLRHVCAMCCMLAMGVLMGYILILGDIYTPYSRLPSKNASAAVQIISRRQR